jgi:hypothetical protein
MNLQATLPAYHETVCLLTMSVSTFIRPTLKSESTTRESKFNNEQNHLSARRRGSFIWAKAAALPGARSFRPREEIDTRALPY